MNKSRNYYDYKLRLSKPMKIAKVKLQVHVVTWITHGARDSGT